MREAGNRDQAGIEQWDAEDQQWYEKAEPGRAVGSELQTEHRNEEADKEAAGITHIDPGGVKVVPKEANGASGQRYGQTGDEKLTVEKSDHEEKAARNGGHTRREAVHVVEQVEGVGDTYDPGNCHEAVDRTRGQMGPDTQRPHTDPSRCFDRQAQPRAKSPDVVDQTHCRKHQSDAQDG